jgi:hypothetical protein
LSPVIANFFMEDFKEKLLKRATHKPLFNQIRRRQLRELAPWTRKAGRLPPSPQQHTAKHEGRDTWSHPLAWQRRPSLQSREFCSGWTQHYVGHCIRLHSTSTLAKKSRHMDQIIREAKETELHPNPQASPWEVMEAPYSLREGSDAIFKKNMTPSGGPENGRIFSYFTPYPDPFLVTCLKAPLLVCILSHIPSLWLALSLGLLSSNPI